MYLFYKFLNITSNKFINIIKIKFYINKVGYLGTLDPLAVGLLPVIFSTDLINYINFNKKRYLVLCFLGVMTNTFDFNGKYTFFILNIRHKIRLILKLFKFFKFFKFQLIPLFSSTKHFGIHFYTYARYNIIIQKKHYTKFYYIKILRIYNKIFIFDIVCNSGLYIRSVVNDLCVFIQLPLIVNQIVRLSIGKNFILNSRKINK